EYLSSHSDDAAVFTSAMTCLSQLDASAVAAAYDFSGVETIVDVGGGQGTFLAEIIRLKPAIRGIVLDRPAVIEEAKKYVAQEKLADRISLASGDFFEAVAEGGDLYVVKNVLMDWDDQRALTILRNCRRAMQDASKLIIIEPVIPAEGGPHFGK